MSNNEIFSWSFSNDKGRGSMWYVIALSVIIGLVVWGFLTKQYVMSFLIILITGVTFFVENNSEENTHISITNLWIKVNNFFYDYSKITAFSLIYDGDQAVILRLQLVKKGIKYLDIMIDNEIVPVLKEILPNFLQEDEHGEFTFTDKIIRILKL